MLYTAYYHMFCTIGTANLYNIVCWILLHVLCHGHCGFIFCMLCTVTCLCYGHCCFICYMFVIGTFTLLNQYRLLYILYAACELPHSFVGIAAPYLICRVMIYVWAMDFDFMYIVYCVVLCTTGTATLYLEQCCFICYILCTATCFQPQALLLNILYTVYCHMFVLWALLCFVHVCCRAACFVPQALLLHILYYGLVPHILLYCASRHGYFLHMLHFCASLLYMIINNRAANDIIISLIYTLLMIY